MKILSILAHPDDEIIFGWPIFQNVHIKKHLICVSGDSARLAALQKSSEILNFSWECLNSPDGHVSNHAQDIQIAVRKYLKDCDKEVAVFTHNPHGEYSHPDHIAVFQAVKEIDEIKLLLISDMSISLNGSGFPETPLIVPDNEKNTYYKNALCELVRNKDIYSQIQSIYKSHKSWTWGKRTIDSTKLFFAKQELIHRKYIIDLLSSLLCQDQCSIVEIGVYKGITSHYLSLCDHIGRIYAIDPWKNIKGYGDHKKMVHDIKIANTHGEPINATTWEELYQYVVQKLDPSRVTIFRNTSEEAAELIKGGIDMIFIDGDHSYDAVTKDLELWVPKVKSGGVIAGHDYTWTGDHKNKRPLVRAVLDYFNVHYINFQPPIDPSRNAFINRQSNRVWWQKKI